MSKVILCPCGKCLRPKADRGPGQLRCPFCGRTHAVAPAKESAAPKPKPRRAESPSPRLEANEQETATASKSVAAPKQGGVLWSFVLAYGFLGLVVFGILWICGIPIPRWISWTQSGVLIALLTWAWATDKPAGQPAETEAEESTPTPPPPSVRPPSPPIVLPEGVKPAPDTLRCAVCKESEVLVLPPNLISRRPGYICPRCGALMRPQRSTGIYLGILVLGGFGLLLGLVLVVTFSFVKRDDWTDNRVKAAGQLLLIGLLVTGFAFHQLRRPTPLGYAPAAPIPWWPWLVALGIVLLGFCVLGGGIVFILFYIQHGM